MSEYVACIVDGANGIYVPRSFVTRFDVSAWGIDSEDAEIFENPDHEFYWETWEDVLDNARYTDDKGVVWSLYQNEDLFAIAWDKLTDEEKENLSI